MDSYSLAETAVFVCLFVIFQPGFYDITSGCLPCDCNQGGSVSPVCDQSSDNAQCPCIPNVESTTCRLPATGYYSKALDDILFEAEDATLSGVYNICCKSLHHDDHGI